MAAEIALVSEAVTFFDAIAQGRIFRADERPLIELHIASARQHVERYCNRVDFHRGRFSAPESEDISGYCDVQEVSLVNGVRVFDAGRLSLDTLPLAKLVILQVAIANYDNRASIGSAFAMNPTTISALSTLRYSASRPLTSITHPGNTNTPVLIPGPPGPTGPQGPPGSIGNMGSIGALPLLPA